MLVTEADLVRDLANAHRVAAAPDDLQRITDRPWWLGASTHSLQKPCFDQDEACLVITRFAEIIAQPADLVAEDGVQFHDATGKLAERQTEERPGATRSQTHSDEMHVTSFVDDDGCRAFAGNPAVSEGG